MNLDNASGGDLDPQYWFERELIQVRVSHSQPHRTAPNAGEGYHIVNLRSVFFINQDEYIVLCTIIMHIVRRKSLAEIRRFLFSSLQSPRWALCYIIVA